MATLDVIVPSSRVGLGDKPTRLRLTVQTVHEHTRAMSVPNARVQPSRRIVTYPADPFVVNDLRVALADTLTLSPATQRWYDWCEVTSQAALHIASLPAYDSQAMRRSFIHWDKLYGYQQVGAAWLRYTQRSILGDDMGVGKTLQALAAVNDARRVLIATVPLAMDSVWREHIMHWTTRVPLLATGTRGDRQQVLDQARRFDKNLPFALIVNHEMLQVRNRTAYPMLWETSWDAIILDEAHKFQSPKSQMSKGAELLHSNRLYLLTGTPVWKNPNSVWHLLHLIDPQRFSSYWAFVNEYCAIEVTPWANKIIGVKPEKMPRLQALLAPYVLQRKTEDVLPQLPEKRVQVIEYDLSAAQRRAYRAIKKEYKIVDSDGAMVAALTSTSSAFVKLRALCNAPSLANTTLANTASAKDDVLDDLLDEALSEGRKVLVFVWHRNYADYLERRLSARFHEEAPIIRTITGDIPAPARQMALGEFKLTTRPAILIATIATTGVAIDLTEATVAIFAEGSHVPAQVQQAEKRLHRIGQKFPVMIYRLSARRTVESALWQTVDERADSADEMLCFDEIIARTLEQED